LILKNRKMKLSYIIKKSICAFVLLSTVTSCDSILEQTPYSQLSDSQFWRTNSDANAAVSGIYDAMQKHYKEKYFLQGEMRSDNFSPSPTAGAAGLELMNNTLTPANTVSDWTFLYQAIGRANIAIEKVPTVPGYDKNLLGEARMLRAFLYFDAIRIWGDVPLYTDAITNPTQELLRTRTDANKIMNEIVIPDMLEGEKLISTAKADFRFAKPSVFAFQATVYMHLRQYANAKIALNKLIALKSHSLVTTREAWQKLFLNDTSTPSLGRFMTGTELILSIGFSLTEDSDRSGIYNIFFAGLPTYLVSPTLSTKWLNTYPQDSTLFRAKYPGFIPKAKDATGRSLWGDWRYLDSRELAVVAPALPRLAKYNKININGAFDDTSIHLFRYADMILMLAEVENQIGTTAAAVAALNQVRDARQLPLLDAKTVTSKTQLENIILDERQFELLGEGKRWWDLVRTNKTVEVMGPINKQTQEKIVFPIFNTHLIENKLLIQNEAYK
jgi:starch-binding outer membrane protein, SusD/RagB family